MTKNRYKTDEKTDMGYGMVNYWHLKLDHPV